MEEVQVPSMEKGQTMNRKTGKKVDPKPRPASDETVVLCFRCGQPILMMQDAKDVPGMGLMHDQCWLKGFSNKWSG
jgi:hypothetical protein